MLIQKTMTRAVGIAIGLAFALACWAETAIVPVRHRLAEEVVKALAPVLDEGERLVAVPDGVWVQASRKRIEEIAALVASLDQPLPRLTVTVLQSDRLTLAELNAQGGVAAGEGVSATAKVYETRSQGSLGLTQRLEVLDGQPAWIAVGQELPVPVINWFGPQAIGGIDYLPVTTGFQLTPRLIGCRVQLAIAPWSRRPGGLGSEFAVHAAETILEVPLGRWVELGSSALDEEWVNLEILSHRYETGGRALRLFVKVDAPLKCEEK